MRNFFFYTLVILLIASVLFFVLGYWKIGMLSGWVLAGLATGVSVIYSVKSKDYGREPLHNESSKRGKKYRD